MLIDVVVTPAQVIKCARTYLETPFHHQGRVKAVGIDCVGLVIGVANELGLSDFNYTAYGHSPHAGMMEKLLLENMDRVSRGNMRAGDILHLTFDKEPQHLAILTDSGTIIHAYAKVKKCVEHPIDALWLNRIRGVFRYKGVRG